MDPGRLRMLGMDSEVWKRHASGWSVWTRFATLPILYLAIWSHVELGWPLALACIGVVAVWLWLNPRVFPAPRRFDRWHARAVLGERVWLNRAIVPVPQDANRKALGFSLLAGIGFVIGLWGAVWPSIPLIIAGTALTYCGKLAFLNVMAGLYDLMRDAHPLYRSWTQIPDNDNGRDRQNDAQRAG
ncbi:hypothetical protein H2509_19495 [Stappia sp. F7233]|uniref:Uncharacterized protein n=2 Tax=Stappia albiluteola TaxID=2758565 RepID=A0A839AHJ2_9HYPH|nr:hypothetical protein [Stappia albiluteola]